MPTHRTKFLICALGIALASPAALADRSADGSRHHQSGVIIYFGESGGQIINDHHWQGNHYGGHYQGSRQGYRQGYRDGFHDGRRERHGHHHDRRYDRHRQQGHVFVVPPGLRAPEQQQQHKANSPRSSARHKLPGSNHR